MKKIILILLPVLFSAIPALSQGITFEEGNWTDVSAKAARQGKVVFVDIYTTWCGPCKTMSNEIFPQQKVGDYFNANFVNFKIDAEKGEGVEFAKKYNVSAFPTFLFLDAEGDVVYRFEGSRDAGRLIGEGEKAVELYSLAPQLRQFEKEYADGNRKVAFLGEYYALLKKSGAGGGTVLNDYLKALPDVELFREDRAADIGNITVADMELYDRLADYTLALDPETDKMLRNKLTSSILKSLSSTFRRSIQDNDLTLFEELLALKARFGNTDNAVSAMMGGGIAYLPEEQLRMNFYSANKMDAEFRSTLEGYFDKLQVDESLDSLRKKEADMEKFIEEARKKAKEENNHEALKGVDRMRGMINLFDGTKYKVLSSFLMQGIEHYMKIESSDREADSRRCTEWVRYAYGIDRSLSTAWNAADILESLDKPVLAREILAEAERIASQDTSADIKESDLETVRKRLAEMP